MKKSLVYIIGIVLFIGTSCEYKFVDPIAVELPTGTISFSQQIEPIFQSKCIACHASNSPILTTGNAYNSLISGNYINTADPQASVLYDQTSGGHPGGNNSLSAQEIAIILKWIQDGAENN